MGRMGPDFMAIVMVRMMHGVMGIRFFFETQTTTPGGGYGFYVGEREKQVATFCG